MGDSRNIKLDQVASSLQIGKGGPIVKSSASSIEFRNSTDTGYARVKAKASTSASHGITKSEAESTYGTSSIPKANVGTNLPELITNGNFDADISSWTTGGIGSFSWVTGRLASNTGTGFLYSQQIISGLTVGARYVIRATFVKSEASSGRFATIRILNDSDASIAYNIGFDTVLSGEIKFEFIAIEATHRILLTYDRQVSASITWDNVSLRQIRVLPTAVADLSWTYVNNLPNQMVEAVRFAPASGNNLLFNGHVIEYPGYLELYSNLLTVSFLAINSTSWVIFSDLKRKDLRASTGNNNYAIIGRDTWVTKTVNPDPRRSVACFDLNGFGYVTDGHYNGSGAGAPQSSAHQSYSTSSDAWVTKTSDLTARNYPSGFSLNGYGYMACGNLNDAVAGATNTFTRYDDFNNSWQNQNSPTARNYPMSSTLNGYGYTMGGSNTSGTYLSLNQQFNDNLNSWTTKTAMNVLRGYASTFTIYGFIYAGNGDSGAGAVATYEQYNDFSNAWVNKNSSPVAKNGCAYSNYNGYGYSNSGSGSVYYGSTFQYNDALNLWETKTASTTTRTYLAGLSMNGYNYSACGYDNVAAGNTGKNEQYN